MLQLQTNAYLIKIRVILNNSFERDPKHIFEPKSKRKRSHSVESEVRETLKFLNLLCLE